jgi:DNA-directed RNA polymerase subunit beta'
VDIKLASDLEDQPKAGRQRQVWLRLIFEIVEGENVREETDRVTGLTVMVIVESATAEKRTPTITIKSKKGEEKRYLLPTGAHVMVQNGNEVYPGDILAKIPRATTKTKDITGGLPRVVELFEARHPRDKAVISEVEGTVHHGPVVKGMRHVIIETDEGTRHEYSVPRSVHVNVQEGERVRAGDPLVDGPIDPHDVLAVLGIKELSATWSTRSRRSTVRSPSPSTTSTSKSSAARCCVPSA